MMLFAKPLMATEADCKIKLEEFEMLEDPSSQLTLSQVIENDGFARAKNFNEGYTSSAFWIRILPPVNCASEEAEVMKRTIEDRILSLLAFQLDTLEDIQANSEKMHKGFKEPFLPKDLEALCKLYNSVRSSRIQVYNHKQTLVSFVRYLTRQGQKTEHLLPFIEGFLDEKIMLN